MGFLFSKPSYDPARDIPDLHAKVALVTGAECALFFLPARFRSVHTLTPELCSVGIGFHTALQLATHGARVYLACITMYTALKAVSRIEERVPSLRGSVQLVSLELDLSSICGVKAAAAEVLEREKRLDILGNVK